MAYSKAETLLCRLRSASQGYGFSSGHVWIWKLDCEEGWALKNWCFWSVVLEKTLESPLDCKEIQPVYSEGDQPWDFFGKNDAKAETPVLWPPHAKSWLIGKDFDAGRCREPAWRIQPMAKVMRKEAWHTQRQDQTSWVLLDILEHLPPKPESAYLTTLCFHLHCWHYGGLSSTTSLWKGVNLKLQLINLLGMTRLFQSTRSSDGSLACLTGLSGHMWLFTASQPWEVWEALNFLNTESFEKLEIVSVVLVDCH